MFEQMSTAPAGGAFRVLEKRKMRIGATSTGAAVAALLALAVPAQAQDVKFEHVMTIGLEGTGEGQFKYVEDFAFSKDGRLLVTDAAHAWVQVFDKSSGKFISR